MQQLQPPTSHDRQVQREMNSVLLAYVTYARGFPACMVKGHRSSSHSQERLLILTPSCELDLVIFFEMFAEVDRVCCDSTAKPAETKVATCAIYKHWSFLAPLTPKAPQHFY